MNKFTPTQKNGPQQDMASSRSLGQTPPGIAARYPGDLPELVGDDALRAIRVAAALLDAVTRDLANHGLPPEAA